MATIRKFTFDNDFGPRPPEHLKREEPVVVAGSDEDEDDNLSVAPPPTFSEEELNLARDSAFEEGRHHGNVEAHQTIDARVAAAMGNLGQQIPDLHRLQIEANDETRRDAIRLASAILKKMLPASCAQHAFAEVAHVVEEVIGHVLDEPRIIVKVADDLVDSMRSRLEEVADSHGFEGRVVVQADARLAPGDCKVEWADGGAERDQARLMDEIDGAVERALSDPQSGQHNAEQEFAGT